LFGGDVGLRVWIDQDLCTGDGLCVDHCPELFTILEDGISYVVDAGVVCHDPGGEEQTAAVPARHAAAVVAAAEDCPGECIFLELE
jgi:ferredoxin